MYECSYCGKKLSEVDAIFIGCCPVCRDCYEQMHLSRGQKWKWSSKKYLSRIYVR